MRATGSADDRHRPAEPTVASLPRFVIEHVAPTIDGGRYPIERILGEPCPVTVDILRDGHDVIAGRIAYRGPHGHEAMVDVPLELLGIEDGPSFEVEDLLSGEQHTWRGRRNYVRLDPSDRVGQIFRLRQCGTSA